MLHTTPATRRLLTAIPLFVLAMSLSACDWCILTNECNEPNFYCETPSEDIVPNQPVEAFLDHSDAYFWPGVYADFYRFEAQADVEYEMFMETLDFDAYLVILEGCRIVIEDDDSASYESLSPYIHFTVPYDGVYTIVATSFSEYETGSYTLDVMSNRQGGNGSGANTWCPVTPTAGSVEPPNMVLGSLSAADPVHDCRRYDAYEIDLGYGERMSAYVEALTFDVTLSVLAPDCSSEYFNDDFQGTNAFIPLTARVAGKHVVVVSSQDCAQTGNYNLFLNTGEFVQPYVEPPTESQTQCLEKKGYPQAKISALPRG